MPYSEPANLGIVACPGGQAFAQEVIVHLRHMYKHRFNLKRDVISKRYNVEKEELVKEINFYNDLQTSDLCVKGNVSNYRPPEFLVDAEFTSNEPLLYITLAPLVAPIPPPRGLILASLNVADAPFLTITP